MGDLKFKKINLFDLAAIRVKNSNNVADVKPGDLVEIISPFVDEENYLGIAVSITEETMLLYHADVRKEIEWNRRVKCNVYKV